MTGMSLTQALRRNAELFPENIATIAGARRSTWRSTIDRVARLAVSFRHLGADPGDRIAILALNSDRYIEALYATLWAGCIPVPLNTRWSRAEMRFVVDDCEPALLLFDGNFDAAALEMGIAGERLISMEDAASPHQRFNDMIVSAEAMADASGAGNELAVIFYTGGTTGKAKGVMLSHANLIGNFLAQQAIVQYPLNSVFLHIAPMFHLADACCLFGMTFLGATHVVLPAFDPNAAMRTIASEGVDAMLIVPTMLTMLVDAANRAGRPIPELRNILYGASPISEAVLRDALAVFPNARFAQAYGQTEASPVATILEHKDHLAGRLRAAGRPIAGVDMRLVEPDMRDVAPGSVGEVLVRGPNVMLGYWRQPELTAATIVDGWLRTGDAGYRDEAGYLYLVDRVKDMIISGGENVYSAEVENALMQHPAVLQCAVIGVPDAKWGEAVHAYVQLREGAVVTGDALRAHTQQLIAGYKCPKSFTFQDEPLPLSGAGKILKSALRQLSAEGAEANS